MEHILYEQKGHIGIVTINRPKALNALNSAVIAELRQLMYRLQESDLRCLIITGSGSKAFVAGADIAEMKDLAPDKAVDFSNEGNEVMEMIESLQFPVIAAVNGYALGGGCELALSCDIRIASENAVFALPEVSLGILPGYGGVQRLARIVGIAKAKEMVYTTNRINSEEALACSLINKRCSSEQLMEVCMEMAEKIASNAPVAVRGTKEVFYKSVGRQIPNANRLETGLFGKCFVTDDRKEAMTAFVEKRKPEPFTGK